MKVFWTVKHAADLGSGKTDATICRAQFVAEVWSLPVKVVAPDLRWQPQSPKQNLQSSESPESKRFVNQMVKTSKLILFLQSPTHQNLLRALPGTPVFPRELGEFPSFGVVQLALCYSYKSKLLWPKGLSSNLFWSNFLSITLVLQNVMSHLLHWTLFKVFFVKQTLHKASSQYCFVLQTLHKTSSQYYFALQTLHKTSSQYYFVLQVLGL